MKLQLLAVTVLASIALFACNGSTSEEVTTSPQENLNFKEMVYNFSMHIVKDQSAVITPNQLIVEDSDGKDTVYDISKEDFLVSIAPYINKTHPWTNHSLTGCRGELIEEEFHVYIVDQEGNVLVDETRLSQPNGFIDVWLPRDLEYKVKIEHQSGKKVESVLSTFQDDGTCITNLQLL